VTRLKASTKESPDLEKIRPAIETLFASEHAFYEVADDYRQKTTQIKDAVNEKKKNYPSELDELKLTLNPLVEFVQKSLQQINDEKTVLEELKTALLEATNQTKETGWINEVAKITTQSKIVKEPLLNLQKLQRIVEDNLKKRTVSTTKFEKSVKGLFKAHISDWREIESIIAQFEGETVSDEIQKHAEFSANAGKSLVESISKVTEGLNNLSGNIKSISKIKNKSKTIFNLCISDLHEIKSLIHELSNGQEGESKRIKDAFKDWMQKNQDLIEAFGGAEAVADLQEILASLESEMDQKLLEDHSQIEAFKSEISEVVKLQVDKAERLCKRVIGIIEEAELSFDAQTKTLSENIESISALSTETIGRLSETAKMSSEFIESSSGLIGKLKSRLSVGEKAQEELKSTVDKVMQSKKKFEGAIVKEIGVDELKPFFDDLAKAKQEFQKALQTNEEAINEAATIVKDHTELAKKLTENLGSLQSTFNENRKQFDMLIKKQSMILSGLTSLFRNVQKVSEDVERIPEALETGMQEVESTLNENFKARNQCLDNLKNIVAMYMRTNGAMIRPIAFTIDAILQGGYRVRRRKAKKPEPVPTPPEPIPQTPEVPEPLPLVPPPDEEATEKSELHIYRQQKQYGTLQLPERSEQQEQVEQQERPKPVEPEVEVKSITEEMPPVAEETEESVLEEEKPVKSRLELIKDMMGKEDVPKLSKKSGKSILKKLRKEVLESEQ